jgi:hypothetical protein
LRRFVSFSHGSILKARVIRKEHVSSTTGKITRIYGLQEIPSRYFDSFSSTFVFDLLSNFDCCRRLSVPTGSRITITGGTDRNILPEAAISCIQQIFPHKKFFLLIVFFALPKYILHYILNNKKDDNDDINKYMFCLRNDDGKRTSTI